MVLTNVMAGSDIIDNVLCAPPAPTGADRGESMQTQPAARRAASA
jgi:hypothetical protein